MTHEELLAITARIHTALHDVVTLHYPESEDGEVKCWTCNTVYPCLTISTVERALR